MMEHAGQNPGYIIASSEPVPGSNKVGDNPPHAKAKARYQDIVPTTFFCTQEHPNQEAPQPIVFQATSQGFVYTKPSAAATERAAKSLAAAVAVARGSSAPPTSRVGFGQR